MIINFLSRRSKLIAWSFYFLLYSEWLLAAETGHRPTYRSYEVNAGISAYREPDPLKDILTLASDRRRRVPEKSDLPFTLHRMYRPDNNAFGAGPPPPHHITF